MNTGIKNKLNVLYLSRWYPNRYDPMPGLFIQRHAEAAALNCNIGVVYVHPSEEKTTQKFEVIEDDINGVPTVMVYYKAVKSNFPIVTPFCKITRFYRANFIGIRRLEQSMGKFNLLHIHILTRLGIIGLYYKWFKGINFVISEHWSRYLPATANFTGILRKSISRLVVKNAAAVTTVTENLAQAMKSHKLKNENYRVLANVLSPDFLEHDPQSNNKIEKHKIVHVSCFEDKSKNISGILRVIKKLGDSRSDFSFTLVGDGMDFERMKNYASEIKINPEILKFTGLLEGKSLVDVMSDSSALLIFSNYENFPVVINEAMSLGVPVISTNVGGIAEYLNETNGILIPRGDENELFAILNRLFDGGYKFDNKKFSLKAKDDFSMENVGKQLYNIYLKAL
ncbi:MAG: hypothetical protein C0598_08465 [Marinilabiliales bacterium]|nr:MAG: hypothetical protein C0598_08465 [Marinilabiliales bacterium]